jgi:hypothetical protein
MPATFSVLEIQLSPFLLATFSKKYLQKTTEEIFLDKSYGIFDRALTFRIGLIAHPELQILFGAEIFKNTGLNDFAVGLTGDEHRILIDDQDRRSPPKLAEAPVDRLAGFCGVIFVVLRIYTEEP